MSVTNVGNKRWRVVVKTGYNPETGKPEYFDSTIKGSHEDAKRLEAEHTLFDKSMFSSLPIQTYSETVWLPAIKDEVAKNTYDFYAGTLKRHVYPYIGHEIMRDFDVAACKAYFLRVPESKRTVARKTLSAMFSYAAEDGLIPLNPVKLLTKRTKTSKPKKKRRKAFKTFSEEECLRFQKAIEGTVIEAVCLVMLNAGARREEACALDWGQFDWEYMSVPVERAYVVLSGSGACEMKEPKNEASWRDLIFDGYSADRLYQLSIGQSGPICKDSSGKRMRPDDVNKLFRAVCRLYGLSEMNVSHLRHTFATQHIKSGTDVATLRELMGHSTISAIINEYLLPLKEDLKGAQKTLADKLDPRKMVV